MISPVLGISRWDYKSRWLANGSSCTDVENSEECFLLSLSLYIYILETIVERLHRFTNQLLGNDDLILGCNPNTKL